MCCNFYICPPPLFLILPAHCSELAEVSLGESCSFQVHHLYDDNDINTLLQTATNVLGTSFIQCCCHRKTLRYIVFFMLCIALFIMNTIHKESSVYCSLCYIMLTASNRHTLSLWKCVLYILTFVYIYTSINEVQCSNVCICDIY